MSFQAYLDNIETKTGCTPQQFIDEAVQKGFDSSTKAGEILQWLADDYGLGRGHGMAVVHIIKHGAKISDKHVNSGSTHSDPSSLLQVHGKDELPFIGAPAKSALAEVGVTKASQLKQYSQKELLAIHGVGPKAIRLLQEAEINLKEEK
ncbi:MAG TPA: DUF4287 domain-containing protein [Candidatus Saccharimonadales bacterium]